MSEIDDEDYVQTLAEILEKKSRELKESNPLKRKQKLVSYALSKGFESDLVFDLVKEIS